MADYPTTTPLQEGLTSHAGTIRSLVFEAMMFGLLSACLAVDVANRDWAWAAWNAALLAATAWLLWRTYRKAISVGASAPSA